MVIIEPERFCAALRPANLVLQLPAGKLQSLSESRESVNRYRTARCTTTGVFQSKQCAALSDLLIHVVVSAPCSRSIQPHSVSVQLHRGRCVCESVAKQHTQAPTAGARKQGSAGHRCSGTATTTLQLLCSHRVMRLRYTAAGVYPVQFFAQRTVILLTYMLLVPARCFIMLTALR
jgi:hypothetical protein